MPSASQTSTRGVQLQLGTGSNPALDDTTVVLDGIANAQTYFQLRASTPGR